MTRGFFQEKIENGQNEIPDPSLEQQNESIDWCQMTETNDWNQSDQQQQSVQDCQQASQQASQGWVSDRGGYRGRGGRRGTSNSYNSRGRGNYQQNGRGGQGKKITILIRRQIKLPFTTTFHKTFSFSILNKSFLIPKTRYMALVFFSRHVLS